MAKGPYTYEYSDEHGDYTIRKFVGTNIAYKIYDTYDGEKDTPEKAMKRSIEERKAQGKDVSFLEKRLKDKPEASEKEAKEKETSEKEDNGEPKLEYKTGFHLEAPVNDFDAAQAYLSDDDMTQYIPDELKDVVKDVKWELEDEEGGTISFKTTRELTAEESKKMSDWIDGQNSDGLGEGFEQQEFATSYFDPDTGDGPYTYREYEAEMERQWDELDISEYKEYIDEDALDVAVDNYIDENYDSETVMQYIDDEFSIDEEERERLSDMDVEELFDEYPGVAETIRDEASDAIMDDPYEYIEDGAIDHAKQEYFNDRGTTEDDWYTMSSMRTNKGTREQNEFDISEIEPGTDNIPPDVLEKARQMQNKLDTAGEPVSKVEYEEYQRLANEYNIPDMTNNGGPYIESLKTRSYEDYASDFGWQEQIKGPDSPEVKAVNERIDKEFGTAEKNAMYEQDKELSKKINEPGFEDSLVERYKNDPEFREMMDTLTGGPQEGSRLAEVRKELEAQTNATSKTSDIAREFLNPDNEYTDAWLQQQAQENGIEIADLDREIGRQMREGGMSYGQRKSETANSADRAQRIIDDDEWYDVTVNKNAYGTKATLTDQRTGKTVELDPYDSDDVIKSKLNELRPGLTEAERYYSNIPEKDIQQDLEDRKWRLDNDRYPDELKESYQKFYDDGKEYYDRKYGNQTSHKNVYQRSDAEIDDAIQTFNDFKQYERFSGDQWNRSNQEERDKLARDSIRNYLMDNHISEKEMLDLRDVMENENHNTEASLLEDVYRELGEDEDRELKEAGRKLSNTIKDYYKQAGVDMDAVQAAKTKTSSQAMSDSIREKAAKPKKERWKYNAGIDGYMKTNEDGTDSEIWYKTTRGKETYERRDYDKNGKEIFRETYKTLEEAKAAKPTSQTMNDKIREAATKKTRNKGIKTIAKEYYGEGWNKLSENQKQIWIERNESWLKSAVEAANKKKK